MHDGLTVTVERSLPRPRARVFDDLESGRVFDLTGAESVSLDFSEGGEFLLTFDGRGTVRGQFERIRHGAEIVMSWIVEGFRRDPDPDSKVWIRVMDEGAGCRIAVTHAGIATAESAAAKEQAWAEILAAMDAEPQ